jgi:hypothetical protein
MREMTFASTKGLKNVGDLKLHPQYFTTVLGFLIEINRQTLDFNSFNPVRQIVKCPRWPGYTLRID